MAKLNKFNVEDILFKEQHEQTIDSVVQAIKASPLFPSIVTIYNQAPDVVRIGAVTQDQSTGRLRSVRLVSPIGLGICMLSVSGEIGDGGTVSISTGWSTLSTTMDRHLLSTSNPRYLQSKVKPKSGRSGHIASENLERAITDSRTAVSEKVRWIIDSMIDINVGRRIGSSPNFLFKDLNDRTATFVARIIAGEVTLAEMPSHMRQSFDDEYKKYVDRRDKFNESVMKGKDFLEGEKWMYFPDVNEGVVLGAIRSEPMVASLDKYITDGHLPLLSQHKYVEETVPFKWYKSFDHIPDELRSGLEYSLAMLKVHRGSDEMLPSQDGMFFWHEMGCASARSGAYDAPCFMLAR
jgi:hypothetical protein